MRIVPRRSSLALLAAVAAAFAAPSAASAAEGRIIVKYAAGADAQERADARADADVVAREALPLPRTEVVDPNAGTTVSEAVADLERSPDVAYAEPNAPRRAFAANDDAFFGEQWALQNTGKQPIWNGHRYIFGTAGDDIDVVPAWDIATEALPTVAVVDSGIDLEHPDLKGNIASGGHDFVDGDDNPQDEAGHGTHVAGTIGAVGNNGAGVTGVAWKAHILPVRVLNAEGSGDVGTVIAGEQYAVDAGAKVVNLSLGGDWPSQTEYDVLRKATNTLFVAAAGNDGANVDTTDSYPCAYDLPNVVCVAATGGNDELASFSNYGASSVDIAAPGVDILSTYPEDKATSTGEHPGYDWLSGTSMATPEVAGAAALLFSQDATLTPWQLRGKLMTGADPVEGLTGKVASGGRLDVFGAMNAVAPPANDAPRAAEVAPRPRTATPAAPTTPPAPPTSPAAPVTAAPPTPAPVVTTPKTLPAPAPAPAPKSTADTTAPAVTPALARRHALMLLLAGRLKASVTTSEPATVRFELRVDGRTAKKLHLAKSSRKAVRIATGRTTLTAAGKKSAALRLTSAAKRALGRLRSIKATLRATATDAAGNARTRSRTVTVTR